MISEQSSPYDPNFKAEISDTETIFLDTYIYKDARFERDAILYVHIHFKPTETFQYTHFSSCHRNVQKKALLKEKGEALRLLRTNFQSKKNI